MAQLSPAATVRQTGIWLPPARFAEVALPTVMRKVAAYVATTRAAGLIFIADMNSSVLAHEAS